MSKFNKYYFKPLDTARGADWFITDTWGMLLDSLFCDFWFVPVINCLLGVMFCYIV